MQLFCRYPFDPRDGEPANNRSIVQRIIAGKMLLTEAGLAKGTLLNYVAMLHAKDIHFNYKELLVDTRRASVGNFPLIKIAYLD